MSANVEAELKRLFEEQRRVVVDKKTIELQLVEEPITDRGTDWQIRAKSAVTRSDKKLSAIKQRMSQLDPSGAIRGRLGRTIVARVFLDAKGAFEVAQILNGLAEKGTKILGFQVIDGKMVALLEEVQL